MIRDLREHYSRPDWVRRINRMGESVGGPERLVPLDADEMVERARASTGLEDFGDYDGDWRTRLRALLEAFETTAQLHTVGRLITRQEILRGLRTRLLLAEKRRSDPELAFGKIDAPIVITGPARSGTSILFELLALDPRGRAPRAWEAIHPLPWEGAEAAERLRLAECEQEFWADVQPEFASIHELRSDLPVECVTITLPSFSGPHWPMVGNIPAWMPDYPATMQYHRAFLQALQHGQDPKTWILKTPVYLAFVDLLFDTYPDAWMLHTHRDPVKTMPSGLSTLATVRWLRSDHVPLDAAGDSSFGQVMIHLAKRREAGELPRIVDVHFSDVMADPVAAVEKAYHQMQRDFLPEHAEAIRDYVAHKPKGKFGKHHYTPEQWGFDPARIREELRAYTDHYGVTLEG